MSSRIIPGPVISGGGSGGVGLFGTYDCDPGVVAGDAVYLNTALSVVDKADADDASKQPLIGFVYQKLSPTQAVVQYQGELSGFVGLTPGNTYFLGLSPGSITNNTSGWASPSVIQKVGFARDATTLVLEIDRDFIIL